MYLLTLFHSNFMLLVVNMARTTSFNRASLVIKLTPLYMLFFAKNFMRVSCLFLMTIQHFLFSCCNSRRKSLKLLRNFHHHETYFFPCTIWHTWLRHSIKDSVGVGAAKIRYEASSGINDGPVSMLCWKLLCKLVMMHFTFHLASVFREICKVSSENNRHETRWSKKRKLHQDSWGIKLKKF